MLVCGIYDVWCVVVYAICFTLPFYWPEDCDLCRTLTGYAFSSSTRVIFEDSHFPWLLPFTYFVFVPWILWYLIVFVDIYTLLKILNDLGIRYCWTWTWNLMAVMSYVLTMYHVSQIIGPVHVKHRHKIHNNNWY